MLGQEVVVVEEGEEEQPHNADYETCCPKNNNHDQRALSLQLVLEALVKAIDELEVVDRNIAAHQMLVELATVPAPFLMYALR